MMTVDGKTTLGEIAQDVNRKIRRASMADAWDAMQFAVRNLGQLSHCTFTRFGSSGDVICRMTVEGEDEDGNQEDVQYTHTIEAQPPAEKGGA